MKTSILLLISLITTTISCKKNLEPIPSKEKEFVVPKKDFLSREWAVYHQSFLNGRSVEHSAMRASKSKAASKMQKGIQFYKIKKDSAAIREYEGAIDLYPLAELYYHYGNSLANLNRLEDSIHAYKISLSISNWEYNDEYSRTELIFYNLACSHSRLNKLDEAYTYLAQAVDRGYNAFVNIEQDPDMENLRKQPDWKEKIQKWRQEYSYNENTVAGKIKDAGPRASNIYYLCKNGIALFAIQDLCRGNRDLMGYRKGIWRLMNGDITIDISEFCEPSYVISKEEKEKYDYENQGASYYCSPGVPKFDGECKRDKVISSSVDFLIRREFVKEFIKKPLGKKEQDDFYYGFSLRKLTENQEPKQCDPGFIPKTLEDIIIQEIH